jgi:hypothetical protein
LFTSQQHTTTTTTITNIQPTANDTAEAATAPAPAGMGRTTTTTNGGGSSPRYVLSPSYFFFTLPFLFLLMTNTMRDHGAMDKDRDEGDEGWGSRREPPVCFILFYFYILLTVLYH